MSKEEDQSPAGNDRVLFGGLAGLCAAVIIQVIDKQPNLNSWLGLGVLLQATALPLLVGSLLMEMHTTRKGPRSGVRLLYDLLGVAGAIIGFALLFVHLHWLLGLAFVLASLIATFAVVRSSG